MSLGESKGTLNCQELRVLIYLSTVESQVSDGLSLFHCCIDRNRPLRIRANDIIERSHNFEWVKGYPAIIAQTAEKCNVHSELRCESLFLGAWLSNMRQSHSMILIRIVIVSDTQTAGPLRVKVYFPVCKLARRVNFAMYGSTGFDMDTLMSTVCDSSPHCYRGSTSLNRICDLSPLTPQKRYRGYP